VLKAIVDEAKKVDCRSTFSRAFKKTVGTPPSKWRKRRAVP
jgi:YesN/AraC family two-component response regulator